VSPQPPEKIVISHKELQDAAIDERLAQQRNVGPAALQPMEEKDGLQFIYSNWFYLMLAGALGAFLAWAVMEPYVEDGVLFTGRVEQVDSENMAPGLRRIIVSGIPVLVAMNETEIRSQAKSQVGYTVDDLRVDSVVKVFGETVDGIPGVVAAAVRIEQPATLVTPNLSLTQLQSGRNAAAFLLFPCVAGLIGLMIGSAEGLVCRTFKRALRCGLFGLAAGIAGGLLSGIVGGMAYFAVGQLSGDPTANLPAFILQMFRRSLGWTIAGTTMGLGQGLALKNRKLMLNGFVGGLVGGLIGGLVFDPIDFLFSDRANMEGAELSRAISLSGIGAAVGVLIGITDMLTRAAWLRVTGGPLRGKEFSFTQTPIRLGSSPKNEIYLFKDPKIDPVHAVINKLRDTYELTDNGSTTGTFVNRQKIQRVRLNDGDRISIGDSEFVYTTRDKKR
jgi:FHA domain